MSSNCDKNNSRILSVAYCKSCEKDFLINDDKIENKCLFCHQKLKVSDDVKTNFELFKKLKEDFSQEEENALAKIISSEEKLGGFPRQHLYLSSLLGWFVFLILNFKDFSFLFLLVFFPIAFFLGLMVSWWEKTKIFQTFSNIEERLMADLFFSCPMCENEIYALKPGKFECHSCHTQLISGCYTLILARAGRSELWEKAISMKLKEDDFHFKGWKSEIVLLFLLAIVLGISAFFFLK